MLRLILAILFFSNILCAEDDFSEFDETSTSKSNIEFNGFVEFEQGIRGSNSHRSDEFVLANRRIRLQSNKSFDRGGFYAKFDFLNDDIEDLNTVDIREMRLQYKLTDNTDISVGRQVTTWGVADMLFINDLFPKNWIANFQGRDMEMLKEPSNSVRITSYIDSFTFDFVYQPKFTPDIVPRGCKFSVFDPNSNAIGANSSACGTKYSSGRNNNRFNEGEFAVSVKKQFGNHEWAIYGYKGFTKAPKALNYNGTTFTPFHSRLNVYGVSQEGQFGPGILIFEAGYYDSIDDKNGLDYFIPNSKIKALLGYRQDLSGKLSYGLQVYQEKIFNYKQYESSYLSNNSTGYAFRLKEYQHTLTLRLTYKLQQETLLVSLFTYIRPNDKDSFTKLEISKKLDDNFKITSGANIFTGKVNYESREFGMLKDDDNYFVRFNYLF
ncbi:hypothetical protein OAB57_01935 [Bacteriovoracaceae bacterium]|nr:hypothetical protein [Bacteriovoracaceae bacterium]